MKEVGLLISINRRTVVLSFLSLAALRVIQPGLFMVIQEYKQTQDKANKLNSALINAQAALSGVSRCAYKTAGIIAQSQVTKIA